MKKFKNYINEMSMSVTLKPKKNNMYKVTKVGDKMKAHGGIKKGEKFHDSEIDGMNDSGIKVKYAKPKKMGEAMVKDQITGKMRVKGPSHVSAADINNASKKYAVKPIPGNPKYKGKQNPKFEKESNDSMQRMADTYMDHEGHKDKKVQSHIKKAKKAYDSGDHEGFYNHTQNAADHAHSIKKEQVVNELSGKTLSNYIQKSANPAGKKSAINLASRGATALAKAPAHDMDAGEKDDMKAYNRGKGIQRAAIKLQRKMYGKKTNEAIERRADRKTIIATDPATGRKVVKVAPKKEIKIGKGKMESVVYEVKMPEDGKAYMVKNCGCLKDPCDEYGSIKEQIEKGEAKMKPVNEISDTTKVNYINKANKAITDKEKIHMKIGAYNVKDKSLEKRRKGVAMAKSKLGEAATPIGKSGRHDVHHTDTSDYNYKSGHASGINHSSKGSDEAGEDQFHYKFKDSKIDVNDSQTKTKLSHVQQRVKASGVSPKHHDAVSKSIHKHITTESVMKMYELKISTMQKYKQAANKDVQDGENARHKGYPEKAIDKQQDKRYKGIDTANKRIAKKQVKMAKGVAFDKRYKGGNMTGASNAINKIKPGLADHPKVANALRRANESIGE